MPMTRTSGRTTLRPLLGRRPPASPPARPRPPTSMASWSLSTLTVTCSSGMSVTMTPFLSARQSSPHPALAIALGPLRSPTPSPMLGFDPQICTATSFPLARECPLRLRSQPRPRSAGLRRPTLLRGRVCPRVLAHRPHARRRLHPRLRLHLFPVLHPRLRLLQPRLPSWLPRRPPAPSSLPVAPPSRGRLSVAPAVASSSPNVLPRWILLLLLFSRHLPLLRLLLPLSACARRVGFGLLFVYLIYLSMFNRHWEPHDFRLFV